MDLDSDTLYLRSMSGENNANLSNLINNSSSLTGASGIGGLNSTMSTGRTERSFTNYTRDYRLSDDKYNSLINSLDDKYNNLSSSAFDTKYSSSLLSKTLGPTTSTSTTTTTTSNTSNLYRPSILTGTNSLTTNTTSSYLTKSRPLTSSANTSANITSHLGSSSSAANRTNSQPPLYSSNIDSAAIDKLFPSSSLSNQTSRYNSQQQDHHHHSSLLSSSAAAAAAARSGSTRDYLSRDPLSSTNYTTTTTTTTTSSSDRQPLSNLHHNHLDDNFGHLKATTTTASLTGPTNTNTTTVGGGQQGHQGHQGQNTLQQLFEDLRQIEDSVTSIEIPARGKCRVFMAKYGYDPFKQSPNDNPDAELAFNAGDYIMVFDDIDEDGYFIGELMDGRRGYVPSNWLDRLIGDDLLEFQATTLYKQAMGASAVGQLPGAPGVAGNSSANDELDSQSYPPEFYDALITDTMNHSNFQHLLAPEDYHRMNDYVDLDDVDEVDDECLSDYERAEAEQMRRAVPPPQRLVVEKLLNKSILISWLHPQSARGTIVSYQVFVDGVSKQTIPSGDRTKALLDGVDSTIPHRVSVRAIDLHGRHSNDAGCTIVIGQNIPFAPSCVKASHITSDSALISWLPCNSNFHHVVAVNSVEVQTVRPGVYKHLINGLSANTLYRVWVRAKPGKILSVDEKNPKKLESLTTYVDFKTMPKSLPDPPVNVQVEAGPQRRTLLVTWLPLTLNDFGSSNGCAVTGYAVFAGHKKLADIDSPTGDHALLDLADLESLHKKSVTVRTKSGENLSQDSMPCQIPDEYLKQAASRGIDLAAMTNQHHHHQQIIMRNQKQQPGGPRLSDSNLPAHSGSHSPSSRHHRIPGQQQIQHHHQQQRPPMGATNRGYLINRGGRQMARSLQNLESDLESRRSSIPAIEITRETSGSDMINPTESYSEEEFENSMRFKGGIHQHRAKTAGRAGSRYRPRQSHSVDGSGAAAAAGLPPGHHYHAAGQQQQPAHRSYQSQANLSMAASNRLRGTPGDIKYFVALFDYDPSTMSPNPNAAADELAFKEGSIIKVYGSLGEDGFYKGEIDNQMGYVPCNVITEITDPNLLNSLYEKSNQQQANLGPNQIHQRQIMQQANVANLQQQQQQTQNQVDVLQQQQLQLQQQQQQQPQQQQSQPQQAQQGGVKRMVALYDYDPQENSPNADTESEIPFKIDDVIYVYGKMDTDGFYMGEVERTKQRGLVPSNFLREDPLPLNRPGQQQAANPVMMNQNAANQMVGNVSVPQQQQQQQPSMDMNAVRMPTMQQQQQQPMGNQNQLRGTNIRGPLPVQQQQQPMMAVDSQQPNNINRPTSLSLSNQQQQNAQLHNQQQMNVGAMGGPMQGQPGNLGNMQQQVGANRMMPMQQQQQQPTQQIQNNNPNALQMAMNNQQMGNQQKSFVMGAGNNMPNAMQQQVNQQMNAAQQQQQQQGGVLSNLLSSGKQIIGAATTPRMPNQAGQFGGPNQAMMGMGQQGNNPMGLMQPMDGNFQPRPGTNMIRAPNAAMSAFNSNQQQPLGGPGNLLGGLGNMHDPSQQQQPMGHNSFGPMAAGNPAGLMGGPQHQQQQQQQHHQLQQQHLQNQQYNQMGGFNRPGTMAPQSQGGMNQMGGEEQGGNILNTVKNMFKL